MASIVSAGTTSSTALNMSADTSGVLQLASNNGSVGLTIDTGQRTTFPTTIGIGNATPSTSGSGISFPATQSASSDANTLDDYEEGTFTPTFSPSSGAWTSYSSTGQYIKVGRTITIFMSLTTTTIGTGSGVFNLSGLPFTTFNPSIGAGNRAAVGVMREDSSAGQINQVYANGSATTGQASSLGGASVTPQGSGFVYEFSLQYITSS